MLHKDAFVTWVGGNRGMENVTARFLERAFLRALAIAGLAS